jgi:hypothetical protein
MLLQGNGILHNASTCHVTGQDFQLYPVTEEHSVSIITYEDSCMQQHIEPVTHQEVQMLQGRTPPDVSELETIAAIFSSIEI